MVRFFIFAVLLFLPVAGSPAFAQGQEKTYSMGAFARLEDYERTPAGDIPAGALKALEGCAKAGLLPSSVVASARASSDDPSPGGEVDELPGTGGPALLPAVLCASGALLAASAILARKVAG